MIQFNLLPDVKVEFVKVERTKRIVMMAATVVSIIMLVLFALLYTWDLLQKKNLSNINNDISTYQNELTGTKDLNKILTIQNQLTSLPTLEKQKPVVSRLFDYISQVTPANATISSLQVDYSQNQIQINGDADSLTTVNVFADTLKFTTYSTDKVSQTKPAFSNVVLASFSVGQTVNYNFKLNFDPTLFDSSQKVTLTVPNKITTRSVLDQPTDIFKQSATSSSGKLSGGQ